MGLSAGDTLMMKIVNGDAGYVLEDVPHLTDFIPDLPVLSFPCHFLILFFFNVFYFI